MGDGHSTEARHPIQVVSRRTGLSQDVIRVWERRYEAVTPERTPTNRRLYSDADIHRLRLLHGAIAGGRRIGDVASLSIAELETMIAGDADAIVVSSEPGATAPAEPVAATHLSVCTRAVETMDSQTLEQELARAAVSLSTTRLLEQVLIPLLRHIGDRWRAGAIRPSQEHLATAVVRSFLGSLASRQEMASGSPEILITTPAGQFHELGALMASVLAVLDGWRATYLGPNLPAEEIAAAARRREVRAIALSVVYTADPTQVIEELHKLRRLLDPEVAMIVGGAGSAACADALSEIGAIRVDEMSRFREELDRLRAGSPG